MYVDNGCINHSTNEFNKNQTLFFSKSVSLFIIITYTISLYVLFSDFLKSKGYTHTLNYSYMLINKTKMF